MRLGNGCLAGLLTTVLVFFAAPVWAGTIQVDVNDGGCVTSPQGDPYSVVYCSIQDAVTDAVDGDVIQVAPGTYNEQITIAKNNLTLQSTAGPATTIIKPTVTSAGGIFIQGDGNIFDGFTVQDYSDDGSENKIVRIHNGADNNTIRNNIIQGNLNQGGISDQTEYGILIYGSNNLIDSNTIYDIGYTGVNVVGPPHSGASNNTISNNVMHDMMRAVILDRSPNTVTANTIYNIVAGTLWGYYYDPALYAWGMSVYGADASGATITRQDFVNLPNGISLAAAQNVLVENCIISANTQIGVKISYNWPYDTPDGNLFVGCDITNNGTDGVKIDHGSGSIGPDNEFLFNNIVGNTTFGMNNVSPTLVKAEHNWWGDVSGPSGAGPGSGDAVSANVDYDPWLTVPVDQTATEHLTEDPDTLDALGEANTVVIKRGSGDPWVTAVQYDNNPGGTHAFTAFTGDRKPAGRTPTTKCAAPLTVTVRFSTSELPSK